MSRPRTFDDAALREGALDVFWTRGYERTSMSDISAATGVGNGSLYAAYDSKLGLFVAVLQTYCDARVRIVRNALSTDGSTADAMRAFFDAIIADCASQPDRRGCLMLNTVAEFGSRDERVLAVCQQATTRMEQAIAERLAAVELPLVVSLQLLAAQILLVSQGIIQASKLGTPADELTAIAHAYCDRLPVG